MSKWKLVGINLLVFFVLFNLAYWSVPTLHRLWIIFAPEATFSEATAYPSGRLPNYANVTWAPQYYREFSQAHKFDYKSFIGWRRMLFHGETINIDGRYAQRRTINGGTDKSKKVYFFGGSTMWGTGVRDDGTIPSQFAALTGLWSENFGEIGYTAHQSLTLLVQLLQDGHRPDIVVFYDGVNEISKCRTELTPYSDQLEVKIDILLKNRPPSPISFHYYFAPLQYVAAWIRAKEIHAIAPAMAEASDCDSKPEKARKIAGNLLADWQMAQHIVESYGGRFVGILQPVSYFSQTRLDHIRDDPAGRAQFQAVYPLVEGLMTEDGGFHNMVRALDIDEYVYFDFFHLSPNGNALIAAAMAEIIKP